MIGSIRLDRLKQPFFWLRVYWWKNRILFSALAVAFIAYILVWVPKAFTNWLMVHSSMSQAREYSLDYQDVLDDPKGSAGKAVCWHIGHPGAQAWFYRNDPSSPVEWAGPEPEVTDGRHVHRMLATVVGVEDGKVRLSYGGLN